MIVRKEFVQTIVHKMATVLHHHPLHFAIVTLDGLDQIVALQLQQIFARTTAPIMVSVLMKHVLVKLAGRDILVLLELAQDHLNFVVTMGFATLQPLHTLVNVLLDGGT